MVVRQVKVSISAIHPIITIAAPRPRAVAAYGVTCALVCWWASRLWIAEPSLDQTAFWLPPTTAHALALAVGTCGAIYYVLAALRFATTTYEFHENVCVFRSLFSVAAIRHEDVELVRWVYGTFSYVSIRSRAGSRSIWLWALEPSVRGLLARQLAARIPVERQRGWEAIDPHLRRSHVTCVTCGHVRATASADSCPICRTKSEPHGTA
jgi:hypothetical protein